MTDCLTFKTWFDIKAALVVTGLICVGLIGATVLLFKPAPALTLHNVRIIERMDDSRFRMASQDSDSGEWNTFFIRFCPTFQMPHEMQAGTTLKVLKYARDYAHDCADISGRKLGYILRRDSYGNVLTTTAN